MIKKGIFPAKILILYMLLLSTAVSITGCVKHIAGGVPTWQNGTLRQELDVHYDDLHSAALTALKELKLPVKEEIKDRELTKIMSQFDDGHHVWIEIRRLKTFGMKGLKHDLRPEAEKAPKYLTDITICVEDIGDRQKSLNLLKTIHQSL